MTFCFPTMTFCFPLTPSTFSASIMALHFSDSKLYVFTYICFGKLLSCIVIISYKKIMNTIAAFIIPIYVGFACFFSSMRESDCDCCISLWFNCKTIKVYKISGHHLSNFCHIYLLNIFTKYFFYSPRYKSPFNYLV
jgi:hypothetical protein